tara:strand:- start:286 stop:546 length:261 start_codon:yes stop_codon:yes gene_type:complete
MKTLEDKLKEDLKDACIAVDNLTEELKNLTIYNANFEDTQHDLKESETIKDYLEIVLGITYIWFKENDKWFLKECSTARSHYVEWR